MRYLITLIAPLALFLSACGGDEAKPGPTEVAETATESAPTVRDLAKAVAQVQALDSGGDIVWHGSGTLISADGLVLTNAHVVDDRFNEYEQLGIAVTEDPDEPPDLRYVGEIAAVDYALDLAVVRIVSDLEGNEVDTEFPFAEVADSADVEIGDSISILGYPGIGGDTITFTTGVVSGFTAERSVGNRAWIKTDATIAGGNSGGLVVNENGLLIGVPTIAGSGSEADAIDCRLIEDTNGDGAVDEDDHCITVGGFINGIRPVNLAEPLIEAARSGVEYVSEIEPDVPPPSEFNLEETFFTNMVFSSGVTADDAPLEVVDTLASGATNLCAFWDYEGMADGMTWDAVWYTDGKRNEENSIIDDTWAGGESGNWWVCVADDEDAIALGLYELIVVVEGEPIGSNSIFVGGEHPPATLEIDNQSGKEICYVYLAPSGAQDWGLDRLGLEESLEAGQTKVVNVPAGTYDLALDGCDEEVVAEQYGLDISGHKLYEVGSE